MVPSLIYSESRSLVRTLVELLLGAVYGKSDDVWIRILQQMTIRCVASLLVMSVAEMVLKRSDVRQVLTMGLLILFVLYTGYRLFVKERSKGVKE